jgi:alpha-beta hydrolase superfamily lysophospholipase
MFEGGKYDPLPWEEFFDSMEMIEDGKIPLYLAGVSQDQPKQVFLCLHGAGHTSLSFACLAKELKQKFIVAAFDFRGHGSNSQEDQQDQSIETLIKDSIKVIEFLIGKFESASIVLLGHSLGGAVAVKTVHGLKEQNHLVSKHIGGLILIDITEGSAVEALPFMENIILQRPPRLQSLQHAVKYGIESGMVRDHQSARVSMPSLVVEMEDTLIN